MTAGAAQKAARPAPTPEPPWVVIGPRHGQDGELVWVVTRVVRTAHRWFTAQIDSETCSAALAHERAEQLNRLAREPEAGSIE